VACGSESEFGARDRHISVADCWQTLEFERAQRGGRGMMDGVRGGDEKTRSMGNESGIE